MAESASTGTSPFAFLTQTKIIGIPLWILLVIVVAILLYFFVL